MNKKELAEKIIDEVIKIARQQISEKLHVSPELRGTISNTETDSGTRMGELTPKDVKKNCSAMGHYGGDNSTKICPLCNEPYHTPKEDEQVSGDAEKYYNDYIKGRYDKLEDAEKVINEDMVQTKKSTIVKLMEQYAQQEEETKMSKSQQMIV